VPAGFREAGEELFANRTVVGRFQSGVVFGDAGMEEEVAVFAREEQLLRAQDAIHLREFSEQRLDVARIPVVSVFRPLDQVRGKFTADKQLGLGNLHPADMAEDLLLDLGKLPLRLE
jgi:hypothetical protein